MLWNSNIDPIRNTKMYVERRNRRTEPDEERQSGEDSILVHLETENVRA
jgi:hypothetical protein